MENSTIVPWVETYISDGDEVIFYDSIDCMNLVTIKNGEMGCKQFRLGVLFPPSDCEFFSAGIFPPNDGDCFLRASARIAPF